MTPSERPGQGAPASLDPSGADRSAARGWRLSDAMVGTGIALALVVLAAAGRVTYLGMDRLLGDAEWVAHTHRVLEGLTRLHVHLVQAISSSRGFVISGDESYLDTYDQSRQRVAAELDRLARLTADNPDTGGRLLSLAPLVEERMRLADAGRVPIVALTADAMAGTAERCLAAGMDDYLSKPIRRAELDAVLARIAGAGAHIDAEAPLARLA